MNSQKMESPRTKKVVCVFSQPNLLYEAVLVSWFQYWFLRKAGKSENMKWITQSLKRLLYQSQHDYGFFQVVLEWRGGIVVRALDLQPSNRSQVRVPATLFHELPWASCSHTCILLVYIYTAW